MAEITQLLAEMTRGSSEAGSELMSRLYADLHRLAASYMRRERPDHTLQPTALVNEAYLRLIGQRQVSWQSRMQFIAIAAQMMRRVLVDHARARLASRRGGSGQKVTLDDAAISPDSQPAELIALDEALTELARLDARQSRIVELRFFAGLRVGEIARLLDVSEKTVERDWTVARAWLHGQLARR